MRHNFKNLDVWKRSRALVKETYVLTSGFPDSEKFGLAIQMRRSAISVPSNIAEGCGRNTKKELAQFFNVANGSFCELETQFYLSIDLGYLEENRSEKHIREIAELRMMIDGFVKRNNKKSDI